MYNTVNAQMQNTTSLPLVYLFSISPSRHQLPTALMHLVQDRTGLEDLVHQELKSLFLDFRPLLLPSILPSSVNYVMLVYVIRLSGKGNMYLREMTSVK
jgi:hypothetical protein